MRHLLITNDFPPFWAGEAQYFYNIWGRLENSSQAVILCPKIPGDEDFDFKHEFIIYRAKGLLLPGFLGRLVKPFIYLFWTVKIVKKHKDICLIHCGNILATFLAGMVIYKFYKIPYFAYLFAEDLRGYGKVRIIRNFFVRFLNNARRVIVISEFTKNRFINKGVKKELFKVIYPGIDTDKFYPNNNSQVREIYNLGDKRIILSSGRLIKRKGFDNLVKALPLVLEKFPDAVLIIRGIGPLEKYLKKLVKRYNLDNYVIFIGYVQSEDLPKYYNACDVFVMPSREYAGVDAEGFGIVFLEAGACEKPVIGGNSGGVPEAIIDGKTGFLVDPLDARDIADKIICILQDKELAKNMGKTARENIVNKFRWEYSAKRLEEQIKN